MHQRLGELLGIPAPQLQEALRRAHATHARLGTALLELRLVDADRLAAALAAQHGVPAARDKHFAGVAPATRDLLPADVARRHDAVPIGMVNGGKELVVAMRDPDDTVARESIAAIAGVPVVAAAAPEVRIRKAIDELYGPARFARASSQVPSTPRTDPYFTPAPARPSAARAIAPTVAVEDARDVGGLLLVALTVWIAIDAVFSLCLDFDRTMFSGFLIDIVALVLLYKEKPWAAWFSLAKAGFTLWYLSTSAGLAVTHSSSVLRLAQASCLVGLGLSLLLVAIVVKNARTE